MRRANQEVLVNLTAKRLGWLSWVVVPLMLGSAPSCSPFGGLIDDICDCEGCSDSRYDDYVDDYEDAERDAENEGCEDQFDEYVSCAQDELECRLSVAYFDGCSSEQTSYYNCVGNNGGCPGNCNTNRAACCELGALGCC
jgi:hypothetical protein